MRAPGRTPEGITSRSASRAAVAGAATLVLMAGATGNPSIPRQVHAVPAVSLASPDQVLPRLLYDRAERDLRPAATRAVRPLAPAASRRSTHHAVRHRTARTIRHQIRHQIRSRAIVRHRTVSRVPAAAGRLGAVVAFARAQVGHSYRFGSAGPGAFDCSGLVMMAYRRAGVRLPHSAAAIAGRAHPVSRASARPGDIVVGSGHVGIYMGRGMMIDAGNPRAGVSYRRMYASLRTKRL